MKRKIANILSFLLAASAFVILVRPYLHPGMPVTHDGNNHVVRFANYKVALKELQIPPRFAPNLFNHYGYPVFNYNYPLANILSVPLSLVGLNYSVSFKLITAVAFVFGSAGLWYWLSLLGIKKPWIKWLVIANFLLSPFALNLTYFRGNIGAVLALNLLVWLFALIDHIQIKKELQLYWIIFYSAVGGCFFLSHNIAVLFGTGILLVYSLLRFKPWKQNFFVKFRQLLALLFSWVLLSLWFWLPAMMEKHLIVLDYVELSDRYLSHLPTLSQLVFSPVRFGFSIVGSIDSLSFSVGLLNIVGFIAAALVLVKHKKDLKELSAISVWLLLSFFLFFFQLPISASIWKVIPLANYIQYPWRLSLFFSILSAPIIAWVLKKRNSWIQSMVVFVLFLQLLSGTRLKVIDYRYYQQIDYELFAESTSTQNENRVKEFDYTGFTTWQPTPEILPGGEGEIAVERWAGSKRSYSLDLQSESTIVEPTMNFAGWKTWANGEEVEHINDEIILGRLAYRLPKGKYEVVSRFTQRTYPRLIGNSASALAWLIWLGLTLKWAVRKLVPSSHEEL